MRINEGQRMIKHIVMFKFKDKSKDLEKAKIMLREASENLEGCQAYTVAENENNSPFGCDLILDSVFNTREELEKYANSEKHKSFLDFIVNAAEKIMEADYRG